MLTVACVLRVSGNTYSPAWARRLQRNVAQHLTVPHRFVCLTNLPSVAGLDTQPLTENWPGWWSKIELFKPGQFTGPVLYLDLDMMACGNIDRLVGPWPNLVMLRDCPVFRHVPNSGLMWWNPALCARYDDIYLEFKADAMTIMQQYSGLHGVTKFGDQGFITHTMTRQDQPILHWQDMLPASWFLEFSYLDKINPTVADNSYDKAARVCYSLGYPKFAQRPDLPIVQAHWTG